MTHDIENTNVHVSFVPLPYSHHNTATTAGAPAATWKQLGSEAVRSKENDGMFFCFFGLVCV